MAQLGSGYVYCFKFSRHRLILLPDSQIKKSENSEISTVKFMKHLVNMQSEPVLAIDIKDFIKIRHNCF